MAEVQPVTVHITVPRREYPVAYGYDTEEEDRRFGRAVREEVELAIQSLRQRGVSNPRPNTIEIVLTETARAEIEDDPEAHTP